MKTIYILIALLYRSHPHAVPPCTLRISNFRYEYSRHYHSFQDATYYFPNDVREQDRLDIKHKIFYIVGDGKLHKAKLKEVHRVLKIGVGTGIWAVEFTKIYPVAEVLGIDLSPIQLDYDLPRVRFSQEDSEDERNWNFGPTFNYIYIRSLLFGISD
jgi:hypothetical protein